MAEYKVTANFQDKTDSKIYHVGDVYEGTDESRIAYLVENRFIEQNVVEAEAERKTENKARNQKVQDQAKEQNVTKNEPAKSAEQLQNEAQQRSDEQPRTETKAAPKTRGNKAKEAGE